MIYAKRKITKADIPFKLTNLFIFVIILIGRSIQENKLTPICFYWNYKSSNVRIVVYRFCMVLKENVRDSMFCKLHEKHFFNKSDIYLFMIVLVSLTFIREIGHMWSTDVISLVSPSVKIPQSRTMLLFNFCCVYILSLWRIHKSVRWLLWDWENWLGSNFDDPLLS